MGLFDKILRENEGLFLDEDALNIDYMPPKILFRENEHQYIADCIKPLLKGRTGKNIFITGTPGIGKTAATKSVLNELGNKGFDEHVVPLYVNCWKKDSAHKIILDMCNQLHYKFTLNKTSEQLMNEIARILNKKSLVIVLDEVDKLSNDATMVLYTISEDIFRKTVILITNSKDFFSLLDQRIRSRLGAETFTFRSYTEDEMHGILKDRVERACVKGVFNEKALRLISNRTFELKDVRVGLHLLREAGNLAEQRLKRKIEEEDVRDALQLIAESDICDLSDDERFLFELIKNNFGKTSKEIYKHYGHSVSYRTFLRRLKDLEEARLISIKEENQGAGKQFFVYLGYKGNDT